MTPEELDAIKARSDAATGGQWINLAGCVATEATDICIDAYADLPPAGEPDHEERWMTDATFIAHARQDVPALVAEVERLSAVLAARIPWFEDAVELIMSEGWRIVKLATVSYGHGDKPSRGEQQHLIVLDEMPPPAPGPSR